MRLTLFGPPRLERDGKEVKVRRRKGLALLAYLAATGQPHGRDTLATLFWPDGSQRKARGNLRRVLSDLKRDIGEGILILEGDTVRLAGDEALWLDVARFRECLAVCAEHDHDPEELGGECLTLLDEAAELYQADFLAGFTLRDTVEFDDWQYFEAEGLRREYASILEKLVNGLSAQNEYETAIPYARERLALDPLHEPAQQVLMQLYHQAGQSAAALRQYELFAELLEEELGVAPIEETKALYEAIRIDRQPGSYLDDASLPDLEAGDAEPAESVALRRPNLPAQPTPFIGRLEEVAEVGQLLQADPPHRLVTLLGPGGIGKTRLALAVAAAIDEAYAHGVHFVPLSPLQSADHIASAVAESIGLRFFGAAEPREQLLDYLQSRELLLLLDNFEHLLAGTVLIDEMLRRAPEVQILVTSRERLNLSGETQYAVGGLPFPDVKTGHSVATVVEANKYGAIQLLQRHARRARPRLTIGDDEVPAMVRICQLVQGMPLAIVLAAGWLELLSFEELADELDQNLDMLESQMGDIPPRQRSMRAAFDISWERLTAAEQEAFMKLSVFRGGFTREVAQRVSGAALLKLRTLVHKSFVSVDEGRRYHIHELLRQSGLEKLIAAGEAEAARTVHSNHYLEFLQRLERDLKGRRQLDALREIEADFDNVRAAWFWALECQDTEHLNRSLESLHLFCDMQGRYQEGIELLERALDRLKQHPEDGLEVTWARIVARVRFMEVFVPNPDYGRIREDMEGSLAIAKAQGDLAEIAYCLYALGGLTIYIDNDVGAALGLFEQSLRYYDQLNDLFYKSRVLNYIGWCHAAQSDPHGFIKFGRLSLEVARSAGSTTDMAVALANLTEVSLTLSDVESAREYGHEAIALAGRMGFDMAVAQVKTLLAFQHFLQGNNADCSQLVYEALNLAEKNQYPLVIAYTAGLRGMIAAVAGDSIKSKQLGEASLAISANNTLGIVLAHWALALAYACEKALGLAWRSLFDALAQADRMATPAIKSWLMPIAGYLLEGEGDNKRAVALIALAMVHPLQISGWLAEWPAFCELQSRLEAALGVEEYRRAWEEGETMALEDVVRQLRVDYGS